MIQRVDSLSRPFETKDERRRAWSEDLFFSLFSFLFVFFSFSFPFFYTARRFHCSCHGIAQKDSTETSFQHWDGNDDVRDLCMEGWKCPVCDQVGIKWWRGSVTRINGNIYIKYITLLLTKPGYEHTSTKEDINVAWMLQLFVHFGALLISQLFNWIL